MNKDASIFSSLKKAIEKLIFVFFYYESKIHLSDDKEIVFKT
jgi:hypothetical protein